MGTLGKLVLGAVGVAAIVALFVLLRPDDTEDAASTTPDTTQAETEGETGTEESPTTTEGEEEPEPDPEPSGPRTIRLTVDSEEPEIARIEVERDERVVLVVRANVTDHVHLHGYNLMSDVAPGQPARIEFRATVPGRFEIELEDRVQQIAQLTVS